MSIVLNAVSWNQAWIMSDGLAMNYQTGEKISGSLRKFEMLNPQLCIGFTGTYETAQSLINNLRTIFQNLESATVEDAAIGSCEILKELKAHGSKNAQFVFTGLSKQGNFASATLDDSLSSTLLIPDNGKIRTVILHKTGPVDFERNVEMFLQKGFPLNEALRKGMAKTIQKVSMNDKTVNRTTFFHTFTL